MAAMLRDSVVVVVVVVRTRPRAIPLAMITTKKSLHGFPLISHDAYGASRSSAKNAKVRGSERVNSVACTVLSNMADNKRGRGDRDENQENPSEYKNAKQVLREVTSFLSVCKSEPDQPAADQIRQGHGQAGAKGLSFP